MAFGYCFGCGTRVSSTDLEKGHAKRFPQGLCCRSCCKTAEEALSLAGCSSGPRPVEAQALNGGFPKVEKGSLGTESAVPGTG